MSLMCMHSAGDEGLAEDFHLVHYGARALGGAGLIMLETTAVQSNGVIGPGDLGIWDDAQLPGLARLVKVIQGFGQGWVVSWGTPIAQRLLRRRFRSLTIAAHRQN